MVGLTKRLYAYNRLVKTLMYSDLLEEVRQDERQPLRGLSFPYLLTNSLLQRSAHILRPLRFSSCA
jgi:hypothetical protein